ncbi:probable phosphoglycerate mutase [Marininema mesophilum]|uniref:Probable phosphoglycerate mutase n=1 Tax=Marininema mesophilum TaxID=1048340 RepID=A0A1H3B2C5_9BACL|nr:histidine phosphatase family protein [Marininema mesophilum]SDX36116.1 probable phosphoglycerate mutase [Marininema mesophilum]
MTELYLLRHGETEWNKEQRFQGRLDSPLTDRGIRQAEAIGNYLSTTSFDRIITSTSERTFTTAQIVRGNRSIPIDNDPIWLKMSFEEWEGMKHDRIKEKWPNQWDSFWNDPISYQPQGNGESFSEVRLRAAKGIQRLLVECSNQCILLVSHTVTIKSIIACVEKRTPSQLWNPPYLHPTSLLKVDLEKDRVELLQTSHVNE